MITYRQATVKSTWTQRRLGVQEAHFSLVLSVWMESCPHPPSDWNGFTRTEMCRAEKYHGMIQKSRPSKMGKIVFG